MYPSFILNLIKGETSNVYVQLFRYFFVGGIAFIVDYSALFLLTEYAGLYYLISAAIAFTLGLIVNYIISISWVFNNQTFKNRSTEFLIFAVIGCVGLVLNAGIMYVFTDFLGTYYMVSKIISTVLVFFWNFIARKLILFNSKNDV